MADAKARVKSVAAPRGANVKMRRLAGGTVSPERAAARQPAVIDGAQIYRLDPLARIAAIRLGVPASIVGHLATRMGVSKENLLSSLGLSRATVSRKERNAATLSKDESERVLGVAALIGMVQAMVEQSGDPAGFDAARWLSGWLATPLPALAGATPDSYLDTFEGQKLVADLLSMMQSGAYA